MALSASAFEQVFVTAHTIAAFFLASPSIMLSDEESAKLGKASADLAAHFPDTMLSARHAALLNFATVLVMVEGGKVAAYISDKRMSDRTTPRQAQAAQPAQSDNIVDFAPWTFGQQ